MKVVCCGYRDAKDAIAFHPNCGRVIHEDTEDTGRPSHGICKYCFFMTMKALVRLELKAGWRSAEHRRRLLKAVIEARREMNIEK